MIPPGIMGAEANEETTGDAGERPGGAGGAGEVAGAPAAPPLSRGRRIWIRAILVLATILAVLSIFSIWANRQLLNPDNWSKTSTQLLQKQAIRAAVSGYLIDQLYAHVNVSDEIKSGLPKQLQPLSGPLSGALHNLAEQGAEMALENAHVQNIWSNANRAAAQTLVTIVNGGGKRVQIEGGTVSLNLRQIVADIASRLGLPSSVSEKLPASVATLKVVTSKQLGLVRNGAKALHALAIWLVVVVLALYALAMYLATGHRRRTLLWVGWSLVLAGVMVLVGRKIGQGQIVSAITSDASIVPAANDAYSVATSLLVEVATAAIIIGIPVILAAWLAGPAHWATSTRRFLAPLFREREGLPYWITGVVLALVFIWGPIQATRNPPTILLFIVLAFVGAYVFAHQIAAEFPDAHPVPIGVALRDYRHALRERVAHMRSHPAKDAGPSTAAELERLAALHDRGAISDEEYAAAKRDAISGA